MPSFPTWSLTLPRCANIFHASVRDTLWYLHALAFSIHQYCTTSCKRLSSRRYLLRKGPMDPGPVWGPTASAATWEISVQWLHMNDHHWPSVHSPSGLLVRGEHRERHQDSGYIPGKQTQPFQLPIKTAQNSKLMYSGLIGWLLVFLTSLQKADTNERNLCISFFLVNLRTLLRWSLQLTAHCFSGPPRQRLLPSHPLY